MGEEINFYRLDANIRENEILQQTYGLRGHPTLVLLDDDNNVSQTLVGTQSEEILRSAITAVIP